MLYKIYIFSYGKIVDSELDCWDVGLDDINNVDDTLSTTVDGQQYLSAFSQRLHDKIRAVVTNPLLPTDVKKRNLRIYSSTLWHHMWVMGPIAGGDDDFASLDILTADPVLLP